MCPSLSENPPLEWQTLKICSWRHQSRTVTRERKTRTEPSRSSWAERIARMFRTVRNARRARTTAQMEARLTPAKERKMLGESVPLRPFILGTYDPFLVFAEVVPKCITS